MFISVVKQADIALRGIQLLRNICHGTCAATQGTGAHSEILWCNAAACSVVPAVLSPSEGAGGDHRLGLDLEEYIFIFVVAVVIFPCSAGVQHPCARSDSVGDYQTPSLLLQFSDSSFLSVVLTLTLKLKQQKL